MIVLIGVSRIDAGEHGFRDLVGGDMLGSMFLMAALYFF